MEVKKINIEERLKLELEVINKFKDVVGVEIRTEINSVKKKLKELNDALEKYKDYTKASKAYLTRATKRIISIYNSHLRRLQDLHIRLFLEE